MISGWTINVTAGLPQHRWHEVHEMLSDGGYVRAPTVLTVQPSGSSAAQELLFEVFAEAFAHEVKGKRVHAGVGEGQNASAYAGDEVAQWGVHLVVVVGAVQVDHVTGQPAHGEQAHKHQHCFGQTLSGFDLRGGERSGMSSHQTLITIHSAI